MPGQHGGAQRNLISEFNEAIAEDGVAAANDEADSEQASTQDDSEFLVPVPVVGFHPALGGRLDEMDIPEFSSDFDWPPTPRGATPSRLGIATTGPVTLLGPLAKATIAKIVADGNGNECRERLHGMIDTYMANAAKLEEVIQYLDSLVAGSTSTSSNERKD